MMNPSNTRTKFQKSPVAAACLVALGCGNDPVNIGDGTKDIDKGSLASYAALWDGYVEAHTFHSGSDRVRVLVDESGESFLQVGEGDALPLPTDPTVGWPPSVATEGAGYVSATLYESVRYPLGNVRIESERIRFQIETNAAFSPFCELQTPVPTDAPGQFGCLAHNGYSPTDDGCAAVLVPGGSQVPVDCGKVFICLDGCACDSTSCTNRPGLDVPIDAALDDAGDELVGTIILQDENVGLRTLRLQRQ
jgi:hypothetical protein